jgi:ATP-dependent metalloprotease
LDAASYLFFSEVNLELVARGTPGLSGAELSNLVNTAAIRAAQHEGQRHVSQDDLDWARDRLLMGNERKSAVLSDEVKKVTAYHEGGHAIMVRLCFFLFLCLFFAKKKCSLLL